MEREKCLNVKDSSKMPVSILPMTLEVMMKENFLGILEKVYTAPETI